MRYSKHWRMLNGRKKGGWDAVEEEPCTLAPFQPEPQICRALMPRFSFNPQS